MSLTNKPKPYISDTKWYTINATSKGEREPSNIKLEVGKILVSVFIVGMKMDAILGCLIILVNTSPVQAQLKTGFYSTSCPNAEAIVGSTVVSHFSKDLTPGLLRVHFHDCFVQGCDVSILISDSFAEKNALPNLCLRGFEVIYDAKSQIEAIYPGIVSFADILALAARDAVDLSDGPSWPVPRGRRDGRISYHLKPQNMPSPLVKLVGAHTVGQTECRFFSYCLYNFTTSGNADPTINVAFLAQLQALCPKNGDGLRRVALDKDSPAKFDVSFFKNVRDGNGVLESDQRLWEDSSTQSVVQNYAGNVRGLLGLRFDFEFPKAMIKLSSIEVKTGTDGDQKSVLKI